MRLLLLLFFFILLSQFGLSQVNITSPIHLQRITKRINYFEDTDSKHKAKDFVNCKLPILKNVSYVNGSVYFKKSNVKYWGKFEIINSTDKDIVEVIFFNRNFLDSVYCFIEDNNVIRNLGSSGDRIATSEHQMINRLNSFFFHIDAKDTLTVFFSFQENRSIVTDVYVTDLNSFVSKNEIDNLFIGGYMGTLVFMALASLIAFFFIRKRYFLYYSVVLIAGMLSSTTSSGTWDFIFMGNLPDHSVWIHSLFIVLWILSFMLFVGEFLVIKEYSEKLYKKYSFFVKFFFLFFIIFFPVSVLWDYSFFTSLLYLSLIFIQLSLSIFIIKMIKYNRLNSIIIACAFFPTFVSLAVYFLVRNGIVHNDFLLNFSNQIGSLFMLITISFAIGIQMKKEFEQKIELLHKLAIQEKEFQNNLSFQREKQQYNIASLLHDSFGVRLKQIRGLIESNKLHLAQNEIGVLGTEIRDLSHSLSPTILDHISLGEAIYDLAVKMSNDDFKIIVTDSFIEVELSKNKKTLLYNIIQEIINNTIKHAEASFLNIQLEVFESYYYITTEDNGKGFNNEKSKTIGLGIQSIQNRITNMNGVCEYSSKVSEGFVWIIKVPIID